MANVSCGAGEALWGSVHATEDQAACEWNAAYFRSERREELARIALRSGAIAA